ncbi:unnamed protein product [Ectocarpus sp. CCAP 1310/34]|nr:unnamed protein product [Ectocarpus sp. CCAP 1310/34]
MAQPLPSSSTSPPVPHASPSGTVGVVADTADAATFTTVVAPPRKAPDTQRKGSGKKNPYAGGAGPSPAPAAGDQRLTHLVIDSGAIIKGAGMTLASAAENFWTIPEVVAEIRDKKARQHLESLPFELKLREPSDEAMKFAASFARQTGDLRSLSRVDLKVIALAYMLERQETGAVHLRTAPIRPGTKVNSNPKGVSAPTLAPANDATEETSAKVFADAALKDATTTTGDVNTAAAAATADSGKPSEREPDTPAATAIGRKEKEAAGEVESLCTAVKQAWTNDVGTAGDGHGPAAENENDEDEGESEGSDGGSASNGDGEEEEEVEEEEDGDDAGDDDEWEPEGDGAEKAKSEDAATTASAPFSADDFPSLGGGKSGPVPAAAPAAAAASTSSPFLPPAATAALATAHADAPTSSWSLMARSNPAPFKVPAKADPAPLPAAAAPPLATDNDPVGHFATSGAASPGAATAAADRPRPDGATPGTSRIMSTAAAFGGWVNPSNIKSQKAAGIGLNGPSQTQRKGIHKGRSKVASQCRAGCVTTDFAMQNVILQVGLPLLSLDGMAVHRVKQWILRCAACFKTCTEMGRLFCPVCGNATLDRVSCSVNANSGATRVHLRKNHKVNLRGSKFSIPAANPAKGRFEGDLLLREDQLLSGIWAQKARRKEKDVSSMFGEDITGNVGLTVSKSADIVVGYGRKNPNSARGRERRGKKGVKTRL